MESIKTSYKRIKDNKFKYFIFRIFRVILVVGLTRKSVDFIVNDLIYKTPRPNFTGNLDFNILYYIFYEKYSLIGITGILIVFLLDFIAAGVKKDQ